MYNGGACLRRMLDALLNQTFADFEIIISDNASADDTQSICAEYTARDGRIRYFRQDQNMGPEWNYQFVVMQGRGRYFMWSACDDIRSPDFLEANVRFLEDNPSFVASTSPNCFDGQASAPPNLVSFSIKGDLAERFDAFFDNCWVSHGIFYSVMRTSVLREFEDLGQAFFGFDWALDLHLASRGGINRTKSGLMILGTKGLSSHATPWRRYRAPVIGWLLPFGRVSMCALKLAKALSWGQYLALLKRLAALNYVTARAQMRTEVGLFCDASMRRWLATFERR